MLNFLFTILSILIVLTCLGMCFSIWWMLVSGEVEEYRRMYRDMMLRKWLDE